MDMRQIETVLESMCKTVPELPEYDSNDQYAAPFACESGRPGNYFKNAGLTDVFRAAYLNDQFPETLAQVSADMINDIDDVSRPKNDRDYHRQIIGTARMLMRRWARGGMGEALCMVEYGYVGEFEALKVVQEKTGEMFKDTQDLDENGHIDFVTPDGDMVQVKTTVKEPSYRENRLYDKLLWVTPGDYEIVEVEG